MPRNDFHSRNQRHNLVIKWFNSLCKDFGIETVPCGIETFPESIYQQIQALNPLLDTYQDKELSQVYPALVVRYRPDLKCLETGRILGYVEIKTHTQPSLGFLKSIFSRLSSGDFIEISALSYISCLYFGLEYKNVFILHVPLVGTKILENQATCIQVKDIRILRLVYPVSMDIIPLKKALLKAQKTVLQTSQKFEIITQGHPKLPTHYRTTHPVIHYASDRTKPVRKFLSEMLE